MLNSSSTPRLLAVFYKVRGWSLNTNKVNQLLKIIKCKFYIDLLALRHSHNFIKNPESAALTLRIVGVGNLKSTTTLRHSHNFIKKF
jgi:hypothetical protein